MRIESRAVKKLLLIGVGSALMFTMGGVGPAQADTVWNTIHTSTAGAAGTATVGNPMNVSVAGVRCASCHRAHTAKAEFLLKQAQPALCYTCHGSEGSALDVQDGISVAKAAPGTLKALRGGGFEYALIDGANAVKTLGALDPVTGRIAHTGAVGVLTAPAPVTSRHQIDGTTQGVMWGNGAISATIGNVGTAVGGTATPVAGDAGLYGVTLECGSCHDPHGNGNYRILRPVPVDAGKAATMLVAGKPYVPATTDPITQVVTPAVPYVPPVYTTVAGTIKGVNIPDAIPDSNGNKVYTTTNYWAAGDRSVPTTLGEGIPAATATDGYITNIAAWCTTCHTRYLAESGSYKTPNKGYPAATATGVTDATFTYRHRSDSTGAADKPNCIQCHVSHGSNVAMTDSTNANFTAPDLKTPTTAGIPATVDNSRLLRVNNRGTCEMCHNV
jgi:predicted CXXCH cytochrome family protein